MQAPKAVTLKDVAREAGVDVSTASRALSGSYGVHRRTRERVLDVARRLNYTPNRVARGLATGRSNTLALLISDIRNPFFAEVARGAQDAACDAGCDLLLANSDLDPVRQMRAVRSLLEKRVDGIVMNSVCSLSRADQQELAACGVPIVLLNRPKRARGFSVVCADNAEGGRLAGRRLIELGHRHVAHLTGPMRHGNLNDRARGFLEIYPDAVVMHGDHNSAGGAAMAATLRTRHPEVTAIFAANDAVAFGVLRALAEMNVAAPEAVSVIGFDNVEFAGMVHPPLTTIHQPKYELGKAAVEILTRLSYGGASQPPEQRILGVNLVERASCRRCHESSSAAAAGRR